MDRAGVIFDMDGVLVDSAAAHQRAWAELGEEVGVPFTPDLFQRTFGQRNATIIPVWLEREVALPELDRLAERKEELYRDMVRQGAVRIYDRIPQIFDELHAGGATVAIASSGPRANIDLLVQIIGAGGRIDALVASEDVRHGKPHPEVFLTAAHRLGLPAARCAVIEDSVHGIEAAKRGGMWAIAVLTSTARQSLEQAGADEVIPAAGNLDCDKLLARLCGRKPL